MDRFPAYLLRLLVYFIVMLTFAVACKHTGSGGRSHSSHSGRR